MNRLIPISLFLLTFSLIFSTEVLAKKEEVIDSKKEEQYPIGCRPVGYKHHLHVLSLFPGKEGMLQSMYFFFNKTDQTISLYQMRDQESEYSTRYNHIVRPRSWAVLATGEPLVKFICSLGDGKASYGQIIDCADTVKVCEYVNVNLA